MTESPTFKAEWIDDNRLWYEERPRAIAHYYRSKPDKIKAFVNNEHKPTTSDVQAFMMRALQAGGIDVLEVSNCRLEAWSGAANTWWVATVRIG